MSSNAATAMIASKNVITKVKEACDAVLSKLNAGKAELNSAILTFKGESDKLTPIVGVAVDKLIIASAEAIRGI